MPLYIQDRSIKNSLGFKYFFIFKYFKSKPN